MKLVLLEVLIWKDADVNIRNTDAVLIIKLQQKVQIIKDVLVRHILMDVVLMVTLQQSMKMCSSNCNM